MLPFQARVDLGAMAMKGYSAFLKVPELLETHIRLLSVIYRTLMGGGESYPCAEVLSMYFTAPVDWAI